MTTKKRVKGKQQKQASSRRARAGAGKALKMKPLKMTPVQMSGNVDCAKIINARPEELTPEQAQFKKSFDERIKIYEDMLIQAAMKTKPIDSGARRSV